MVRVSGAAALAAVIAVVGAGSAARAAPIEAYGALPAMDQVAISPDGSMLAYVVPIKGKQAVVVETLNPVKQITGMEGTEQKVRALRWADNDHLMVLKSQTGYVHEVETAKGEWYMAQTLDIAKHHARPLLSDEAGNAISVMNVVSGIPESRLVDGRRKIFAEGTTFVDSVGVPALFSVDVDTGRETLIERTTQLREGRDWLIGPRGDLLAQMNYDQDLKRWTLRLRRGEQWVDAYSEDASIDMPEVEGVSPDGASLILDVPTEKGVRYKAISLADGSLKDVTETYRPFENMITDPVTHRIIGGVELGMDEDDKFFNPADQGLWDGIVKAFPGEEVQLVSWSDDRKKVIVRVTGSTHGIIYVMVDAGSHKAVEVGQAYQGIGPNDVSAVETIEYKAADGTTVPAYLTLPSGKDSKNLPLIVLPHGGPQARDEPDFDWWSQALAAQGYAVLQPQFRGSDGFGQELLEAGYGEYGRKMQTDVSDGVAALAHSGIADPKRVCVVGASYGGYVALGACLSNWLDGWSEG